jgi:hypothetical protein
VNCQYGALLAKIRTRQPHFPGRNWPRQRPGYLSPALAGIRPFWPVPLVVRQIPQHSDVITGVSGRVIIAFFGVTWVKRPDLSARGAGDGQATLPPSTIGPVRAAEILCRCAVATMRLCIIGFLARGQRTSPALDLLANASGSAKGRFR